jgi:hypothetical protein
MNLLEKYIRLLLVESRVDDIKIKYPNIANKVELLSKQDPSGNNKYLEWMVKQASTGYGLDDIVELVNLFHKSQQRLKGNKKDLYSYKNLSELSKELDKLPKKSKRQQKIEISEGAEKIYEDDEALLIRVDTKDAVCKYGAGTKWCITSKNERHFEKYSEEGVIFYYMIAKNIENDGSVLNKIAFAVYTVGSNVGKVDIFDSEDNERNVVGDIEHYPPYDMLVEKALHLIESDSKKLGKNYYVDKIVEKIYNNPKQILDYSYNDAAVHDLLEDKDLPEDILEVVFNNMDFFLHNINKWVSHSNNTPRLLTYLSDDRRFPPSIRSLVALHENTPVDVLGRMVFDYNDATQSWMVARSAVLNERTPYYALKNVITMGSQSHDVISYMLLRDDLTYEIIKLMLENKSTMYFIKDVYDYVKDHKQSFTEEEYNKLMQTIEYNF